MRKLFKERKLFKGGNYMRKYGIQCSSTCTIHFFKVSDILFMSLDSKIVNKLYLSCFPMMVTRAMPAA